MSNEQNSVGKLLMFRKLYTTNCSYGEREASPIEVRLEPGSYTVELWGSSGGCDSGGKGAYVLFLFAFLHSEHLHQNVISQNSA